MSVQLDVHGIPYTLQLGLAEKGYQVTLCVIDTRGYVNHKYPSVIKQFPNYWDAKSCYAAIYRYQTGKRLEA